MKFSELTWQSRVVQNLLGDPESRNFCRSVSGIFYSRVKPTPVKHPTLLAWSHSLAESLGIERPLQTESDQIFLLAGNDLNAEMQPHALRYGGHQFGNWAGQLGDGRAISLGELKSTQQGWQEYQLKGAGPTPYSRRADGRAVLRSSVREFLCSEAMFALGVPTTRALCLLGTGEGVLRDQFYDGNAKTEPGAIVARVAPSFLRFGNFEILAAAQEFDQLKLLLNFLVSEFIPELDVTDPDLPLLYLNWISQKTTRLVSQWMSFGFVHGVMNTDNMSAIGLSIDYGPYGWLENFDSKFTPNTTDSQGKRYCYGRQMEIAQWNLTRLAEALLPLISGENSEDKAIKILENASKLGAAAFENHFFKKCGLNSENSDSQKILQKLFVHLEATSLDFTLFFRGLSRLRTALESQSSSDLKPTFGNWIQTVSYKKMSETDITTWLEWFEYICAAWHEMKVNHQLSAAQMNTVNPTFVLRNYISQLAIQDAEQGNTATLNKILEASQTPFQENENTLPWMTKRPDWAENMPGCSALSCSS